jgi:riboflavin kinase/FMN adenylyltransferase
MVGSAVKIWNGSEYFPKGRPKVVASIGNYDGVHLGHQEILHQVVGASRSTGLPSLLISFDPHPAAIIAPHRNPKRLQTREQKLNCLERTGLSDLLILGFDRRMASVTGEEFFTEVLFPIMEFESIHVGRNFKFGRNRAGDLELLNDIGARHGFEVQGCPAVELDGAIISSSSIRRAVAEGRVEDARGMLGRPFALIGEVVSGEGRGAGMQFPTANLAVENEMVPASGVYVTETVALASRYPSVSNVGYRPTFDGKDLTVETHLLDFEGDLYTERIEIRFLARIRDEMRFDSALELGNQIARDKAAAEAYFQNMQTSFS